jgi:hypothetical protein
MAEVYPMRQGALAHRTWATMTVYPQTYGQSRCRRTLRLSTSLMKRQSRYSEPHLGMRARLTGRTPRF